MPTLEHKTSTRVALNNIVYATDFSSSAYAALPYAIAICRHYGSTLHVAHVVSQFDILVHRAAVDPMTFESAYQGERRAALERMQQLAPEMENTPHHLHIRRGDTSDVISRIITQEHIDLLVVGTQARTGIGKLVMGSVAETLLRQASCPVLTVGPGGGGRLNLEFDDTQKDIRPAAIGFNHIVLAVDFSPESLAALPFAISLAEEFQAHLALLSVIEEHRPDPTVLILPLVTRLLEMLVPSEAAMCCKPETIVKIGEPADKILETASECNADLIVLGVRAAKAHLGAATHFSWSTAHRVIANANCPVLTVRK